jgi:alpha-N-arabinofuranosidase
VSRYPWRWNETIGPLTDRPGRPGTWTYPNTDGLGLIEYFHWCEDLEVEPILAVWSGMFLGNFSDHILSAEALKPWVADTMNELEFLLGSVNTTYGALRASLGYPKPFHLQYVEVGNEDNLNNGTVSYAAYRFPMFYNAIHAKYPHLTIISSTGDYTALAGNGTSSATWIDYHLYSRSDKLVSQFGQFDNVSRDHKTLIGEYAIIQENTAAGVVSVDWDAPKLRYPIWVGAVAEAVWTIGAERNGDAVMGMAYAPGFQNQNSYEWAVSTRFPE